MITDSSRNIMRNALNYANARNSQFADWHMLTDLLNVEYKKLYDDIASHTMDFVKTIDIHGTKTLLPPDCYRILSVESNGIPIKAGNIQNKGYWHTENGVFILEGGGNVKVTYSTVPDTLTAPEKAIAIKEEQYNDIPTDKKNYFVDYNTDGTISITENLNKKFLGKEFDWDLDLEKVHEVYKIDGVFYNNDIEEVEEPAGEVTDENIIGTVILYNTVFYKGDATTHTVNTVKLGDNYYNSDMTPAIKPTGVLSESVELGLFKYTNKWVKKVESAYYEVSSFTDTGTQITDVDEIAALDLLTFDTAYEETYIVYSQYHIVTGFTAEGITEGDLVTDTDLILALDNSASSFVTYNRYVEEVEQKFIWDETDISELIVRDGTTVTNLQMHSPYMIVSYSDGLILIYTGWKRAVWNYNIIFGHETSGEIVALKTDDITGKGCIWHNADDNKFYYCSFVPDTVLEYPTSALFTLMTYRLAAQITNLLDKPNEYLIKQLIPEAEAQFFQTLSYGQVSATRVNNYRSRRRHAIW